MRRGPIGVVMGGARATSPGLWGEVAQGGGGRRSGVWLYAGLRSPNGFSNPGGSGQNLCPEGLVS